MKRTVVLFLGALLFAVPAHADDAQKAQEFIKERCSLCHGAKGEASNSIYPRLAGQHVVYLKKQLRNFRDGVRESETMSQMTKDLSDGVIDALAKHFSSQPKLFHRVPSTKKTLEAVGLYIFSKGNKYSQIPACSSCHGKHGEGSEKLPRLAGQHKRYVLAQLKAFNERKRTNDNAIMHDVAKKLTELERQAVATYVSGLKPQPPETEGK
jgi:cytochrome c553